MTDRGVGAYSRKGDRTSPRIGLGPTTHRSTMSETQPTETEPDVVEPEPEVEPETPAEAE